MKAIYASKLYRSSTRKDKIRAAIENPVNMELVQQLGEYLDDEYKTEQYLDPKNDEGSREDDIDSTPMVDDDDSDLSPTSGSPTGAPRSNPLYVSENDEDGLQEGGQVEEIPEDDAPVEEPVVKESTNTHTKTPVVSQTVLYSSPTVNTGITQGVLEQIKGTLNMRQDTAGVNRILIKEDELWIYYDDKINLNNVMGNVVEFLNAANYTYLDFNRLARSDNAIVFQISVVDTSRSIDTIGSKENGK